MEQETVSRLMKAEMEAKTQVDEAKKGEADTAPRVAPTSPSARHAKPSVPLLCARPPPQCRASLRRPAACMA